MKYSGFFFAAENHFGCLICQEEEQNKCGLDVQVVNLVVRERVCRIDKVLIAKSEIVFHPIVHVFVASSLFKLKELHYLLCFKYLTLLAFDDALHLLEYFFRRVSYVPDLSNFKLLDSKHHSVL